MKKIYKILTIVGTRPEIIKLSVVLKKFDKYFNHSIIHTGQNYDYNLNEVFFKDLNIKKPKYFLNCAGETSIQTISNVISRTEKILKKEKPDGIVVYGDTNSCLSVITAKRLKIPTFHFEAGNRSFDQNVPEELNRKIVDHLADVNLTYSDIAREYLLREGLPADRIIKTGSPMFEVLSFYSDKINDTSVLEDLSLSKGKYFLVSAHREENISSERNFKNLIDSLNKLASNYEFPIIVSTHPRTRNKLNELNLNTDPLIQFLEPLGFIDYNALQQNAFVVLSDSGTISEESSILNFRALNIREAHERPEAMEEASVMMVGLRYESILRGVSELQSQLVGSERSFNLVSDYSKPNVSSKIVRIILSYTSYINRVVWQKQ